MAINRELVLYLDLLVFKEGGDAIYKRARVYELDYIWLRRSFIGRDTLLGGCLSLGQLFLE
jgi:hypothetical protein